MRAALSEPEPRTASQLPTFYRRAPAVLITLLALLVSYLVWGSGLDRLSRTAPGIASAVPEPLRSHAWRLASARALEDHRFAPAIAYAERGVIADPMDAGAIATLGIVRLTANDPRGAADAFRVAASLGWRNQPTQLYWLSAALSGGDYNLGAQRLDAIFRQNPHVPESAGLLAPFEQTAKGRRSLARVLALRPGWLAAYLEPREQVSQAQLAARALVLQEPAIASARLTCAELSKFVAELTRNELASEASSLAEEHCGTRSGLISDGGFEDVQLTETSPLGWQFPGEGALSVRPAIVNRSRALLVESASSSTKVFAVHELQLSPGNYAVQWTAQDEAGRPTDRVRTRLTCRRGDGTYLEARPAGEGGFLAEAQAGEGCSLQWLELAIAPGSGAVSIDDVSISARRQ